MKEESRGRRHEEEGEEGEAERGERGEDRGERDREEGLESRVEEVGWHGLGSEVGAEDGDGDRRALRRGLVSTAFRHFERKVGQTAIICAAVIVSAERNEGTTTS